MKCLVKYLMMFLISFGKGKAQDTFSILAFDSITGEVGAAGASCVDLFPFPTLSNHFICELFPGQGAVASQASYISTNQLNARTRFNLGDSPNQLLSWLQANDVQSNPSVRQYGVVRMMQDSVQTAAFTGSNCMAYKNHIIGPNYTIQGNILLGQMVLDSMEARFKRETGDLACKLMAAMQGAKMVGADSRCASNGSSSLFAFLKVTLPGDTFGNPSFLVSLKTQNGAGIEPIDSLQRLFTAVKTCTNDWVGLTEDYFADDIQIFPNPADQSLELKYESIGVSEDNISLKILNSLGQVIFTKEITYSSGTFRISISDFKEGAYQLLLISDEGPVIYKRLLVKR